MSEVFCNIVFCKFNKGGCCTASRIVVVLVGGELVEDFFDGKVDIECPLFEEVFDISNMTGTHRIVGKLSDFTPKSGFDSVEEWISEFKRLNGSKSKNMAYLYRVRLLRVFEK